jgi:two-component system, chemotaxis family, chemotaxis protein CheY
MNAKVLIVDDSSLARRMARNLLEELGCTVEEATDGSQALERYFISRPDVVFLDMVMSGMYGLDVLTKLRELDPAARVIVATADIQTTTREQVRAAGASAFVNKPLNRATVTEVLNQVLEGAFKWN